MATASKSISVTLVGDTDQFIRSMGKAGDATKKLEKSSSDLGDQIEGSKKHFIGTKDVLDGLSETMGLPTDGAVGMARGFADLADGIGTTLVPALSTATGKIKSMGTTMMATPMGRFKLGLGGIALALGAVAASTESGRSAFSHLSTTVDHGIKGIGRAVQAVANGFHWEARQAYDDINDMAKAAINAQNLIARGFGPDKLVPDLQVNAGDITKWRGAVDTGFGAGWAPLEDAAKKVGTKTGNSLATAHAAALKKALTKQTDILQKALDAWNAKLTKAKDFQKKTRSLFDLAFSGERDQFGSSVGGLADQVRKFERFIKVIGELRKKGLRESTVRSLVDGGVGNLDAATVMNSSSVRDQNKLIDQAKQLAGGFSADETARRGMDLKPKPVKVTLNVSGGDKELVNLIKKWVRKEGGGDVQVAFGGKR